MPVRFVNESLYDRSYPWHDSYLSPDFAPTPEQSAEYAGVPSVNLDHSFQAPSMLFHVSAARSTSTLLWSSSEYDSNFAGPNKENSAPSRSVAGLKSEQLGITAEPAFQRRRKPIPITRTSTTEFVPAAQTDDYILLGDQSKFAPSVRYRSKSHDGKRISHPTPKLQPAPAGVKDRDTQTDYRFLSHDDDQSSTSVAHSSDSIFCKARRKNQETQTERDHLSRHGDPSSECPVHGSDPVSDKYGRYDQPVRNTKSTRPTSPPPAPRYDHPRESRSRTRLAEPIHPAPTKTQTSPQRPKKPYQELPQNGVAPKTVKSVPKPKVADTTPAGMPSGVIREEAAKKRADAEIAAKRELAEFRRSEEAAPNGADYVMRYRAGIAPSRHRGPKRRSEYDMQYGWKDPVKSSPLLAADQVVFKSSSSLVGPTKSGPIAKGSEYAHEFRAWTRPDSVRSPRSPRNDDALKDTPTKKQKMQRSKSMESVRVDEMRPAGVPTADLSARSKRLVKSAMNPLRPYFPHGKFKTYVSEYDTRFRSPEDYAYVDGAWRSANQSRAQSTQPGEVETTPAPARVSAPSPAANAQTPMTASSSWYSEVLELRQKASEYKQRARGTHFSRQHLAQLYAQQADLWDGVSNSSMLSALSLESSVARRGSEDVGDSASMAGQNSRADPSNAASSRPAAHKLPPKKPRTKKAWQEEETSTSPTSSSVSKPSTVQDRADMRDAMVDTASVGGTYSESEGRVPTPKLKVGDWIHRHHLDRTTPAVGGALLTSPPKKSADDSESSTPRLAASQPAAGARRPGNPAQVSAGSRLMNTSPVAAGKRTLDTHLLIDEEASTDRPLDLKYVSSPPHLDNVARRLEFERRHPPGLNIPSTIKENTDTYHSRLQAVDDDNDDVLSISARSVASSCSLASEVLDRARNRRDEFWGKTMKNK